MRTQKRIECFLGITPTMRRHERGQILVLVALAMVGLLVATGLAVDTGFLMMRKSQFDRAVDAAALTGVTVISATNAATLPTANLRGRQLLGANGITITADGACNADGSLPEAINYCGQALNGMMPGSVRYRVVARWWIPTFFMPLIKINAIPVVSEATAEYFPIVDMYASDSSEQGLIQSALLSVFGPGSVTGNGDAYTPRWRDDENTLSPWYGEMNGAYTFRISIPSTYPFEKLRVELLDPDSFNRSGDTLSTIYRLNGSIISDTCSNTGIHNPCAEPTNDGSANPYYFHRADEGRGLDAGGAAGACCASGQSYTQQTTTRTLYRLFYYKQTGAGQLQEVDLAYYVGEDTWPGTNATEAAATDLKWVTPGASALERMPAFDDTGAPAPASAMPVTSNPINPGGTVRPSIGSDPTVIVAEPPTTVESCANYAGQPLNNAAPYFGTTRSNALLGAAGCSGNGDFIILLTDIPGESNNGGNSEIPNIYIDPNSNGRRDIFMQVIAFKGGSENSFSVWAGPSRVNRADLITQLTTDGVIKGPFEAPVDVNARQVYIQRNRAFTPSVTVHSSYGVTVYAMGHMSMNWLASDRVKFPLAYLSPEFSAQKVTLEMFDSREAEESDDNEDTGSSSNGASPIFFYFDEIRTTVDWTACYAHQANDCTNSGGGPTADNPRFPGSESWSVGSCIIPADSTRPDGSVALDTSAGDCLGWQDGGGGNDDHTDMNDVWAQFPFWVPSDLDSNPLRRQPFYGGRLYVSYRGTQQESSTWKLTVDARPVLTG